MDACPRAIATVQTREAAYSTTACTSLVSASQSCGLRSVRNTHGHDGCTNWHATNEGSRFRNDRAQSGRIRLMVVQPSRLCYAGGTPALQRPGQATCGSAQKKGSRKQRCPRGAEDSALIPGAIGRFCSAASLPRRQPNTRSHNHMVDETAVGFRAKHASLRGPQSATSTLPMQTRPRGCSRS